MNPTDKLRIISFLKRIGCGDSESQAYIEILKIGSVSIQELSRRLKKNRISIYYTVQKMVDKGFLFEIRKGKKRFIVAESPQIILKIIRQRFADLKALESDVDYITQLLNSISSNKHEVTVVKLYEEMEGFKKMLEETLEAKGELLIFSNTSIFSKMLGEQYYESYFSRRAMLGIRTRIIYPPCDFANKLHEKEEQYKIDLRILSQKVGSESGFYIWNDSLAIKSLRENKRCSTIIENKDIARFFRENIFNHFWIEAKSLP